MQQMMKLGSLVLIITVLTACQSSRKTGQIETPPAAQTEAERGFVPKEGEERAYKPLEPKSSPEEAGLPASEDAQELKPLKEEEEAPAEPEPEVRSASQPDKESTYTIQKGDTLWDIAESHYGDGSRWKEILAANPEIEDPDEIREGEEIVLPDL